MLNFNDGLVASNALPLTLCDDRVGAFVCEWDVDFVVYGGSTHIVVDLLGYIAPPRTLPPPEP